MSSRQELVSLDQQDEDAMPTPDMVDISVKSLTAKVFLNQPAEDLIPMRYLLKAKHTRKPSFPVTESTTEKPT